MADHFSKAVARFFVMVEVKGKTASIGLSVPIERSGDISSQIWELETLFSALTALSARYSVKNQSRSSAN